jgi:HK97 family phage major capsid protein
VDIRSHVVALNEKRARAWEAQKAVLEATTGRDRSAEEVQTLVRMDEELDALDSEIREFVGRETREQEAAKLREAQSSIFGEPTAKIDTRGVDDMLTFLRSGGRLGGVVDASGARFLEVDIRGAARELDIVRRGGGAAELRALAWDTGSVASAVPTTLARTLYEYMEASNALLRMGTTKLTTASGEIIQFPRNAAHAIATQVSGQGTTLAGTDPTFDKFELSAFKYGELVKVANEVLTDSGVDIASFLGRDMGRALGRITATAFVTGSGSGQPNGVMTALVGSGTIATGGTLITPTVEKLIDLQYSVNDEYRESPACAWLMKDSTAGTLRKLRDGAGGTVGAFIWEPSLTSGIINGTPDRLLGRPVFVDSNVAAQGSNAKIIAFGDFSAVYIRTVGNAIVERDSSPGFATDETWFRAKTRVDSEVADLTALNVMKQSV